MANYIKRDKKDKKGNMSIIIPDSTKLTAQDKADIALYRELGYVVKISRKKNNKKSKAGYTKVELIYYLEKNAPDKVAEFTEMADVNYMKALRFFKNWYAEKNNSTYNGEAAAEISKGGAEAEKRINELKAIEADKKKAREAAKKKAK